MSLSIITLGIVLKRRNVGEADRLVTLFTKGEGKIIAKAKGVRNPTSKRASHIEVFNSIRAQIIEGGKSVILGQTELITDRSALKRSMQYLRISYHLIETVDRLTPERQTHPEVFELLDRALSSVLLGKWGNERALLYAYEARLLNLLGYGTPTGAQELESYIEEIINQRLHSRKVLSDLSGSH